MDDPGDVTAQSQQNVQPEMKAEADLQKNADGRQDNGEQNANDVHDLNPMSIVVRPLTSLGAE